MDVNEGVKLLQKFKKNKIGVGEGSGGSGWGGQGGCEQNIDVCVKMQKRNRGGLGGGVG